MKANLIEIRNNPKQWYDKDNEKYREVLEDNDLALDFNVNNEIFTITINKNTFEKIKNKEIMIVMGVKMNSLNEKLNDLIRISEKAKEISTDVLYGFATGLDIRGNSDLSDFVFRVKNLAFYEANINFDSNNLNYLASKSKLIEKYFEIINGGKHE